ncbi:calcium-binding protein, partial [Azonexus hydrophilus]|uniref:calcium-binding protein n=1 Tax=Azonexus hydrophilus TaxID=418702 RepID=UPI001966A22B
MSCVPEKDHDPISVINKWVSAINFAVGKINPMAGAVTGQFAIATQSGASAVALANGDGTAITAIPGVSVSAPTMAWFAKIGGWVSVMAKAAGVAVPGVGLVAIGMTMVSAAAAAAANKTFSDIVTDPGFWEAIGNGAPDDYLKSKYGITLNELMNSLLDALLTGEMKPLGCPIEPIRDGFSQATEIPSPIILDLDGDGVETTSIGHGTYFDHSADGFAEKTAWVGKDDGLLVWDRNNNGQIDSGRELFGSETLLANGKQAANGFAALAELDSNGDGVIDANDTAFAELRVWKDANGDGRTDAGELLTLAQAGVQSIDVAYKNSTLVDTQGNAHKQVGSYTGVDGEKRAATDVWVKIDTVFSIPTERVSVPDEILQLPDAQGYGKVRDLHQAMALDATGVLQTLVADFTQAATFEERDALVTQIIYHWTGVQDVDPKSRAATRIYGNAIGDARKLEALEEFMGEEWAGIWCWGERDPNPHGRAAPVLLKAWDDLKALVSGQLMAQSHLEGLFQKIDYRWDEEIESVRGDMSRAATALAAQLEADYEAGLADLDAFLRSLRSTGVLDRMEIFAFKAALLPLGAEVSQIFDQALAGYTSIFAPSEGNNVLLGSENDDVIDGRGGNDRIVGRGGNDTLIGGDGNDILDGGAGNDELRGGAGADTYYFGRGDGHDIIIEDYSWVQGEADRIEFKAGISPDDVQLERKTGSWPGDDLKITLRDTGETLTVKHHFSSNNRYAIEEIVFADGTVWDAEAIKSRHLLGGDGDDELHGFNGRDDVIVGGAGNDKLIGLSGNDVLDGGEGDDALEGGAGSDTYRFGRGDGHDTIIEDSWVQGEIDRIEFKAGVAADDVRLDRVRTVNGWQVSDDLKLTLRDTGETLTVKNHFNESNRYAVEEIVFADGTVWDVEAIKSRSLLGEAGDDALLGFNGRDDVIVGGGGNDTLIGGTGDDVLIGGTGDDVLDGGVGSDTYRIGLGDGNDVIAEFGTDGED